MKNPYTNLPSDDDMNKLLRDELDIKDSIISRLFDICGQYESLIESDIGTHHTQTVQLKTDLSELQKISKLHHLLTRLDSRAREALLDKDSELRRGFEPEMVQSAFVISFDIRRSTELMLKAKSPKEFANFLRELSLGLSDIIKSNFGVFDKFTGDGALAFFPDFYSGKDSSAFNVLKVAEEAHALFAKLYDEFSNIFTVIPDDIGLGVGIDYGDITLLQMSDGLTAVGTPVVYACRLSGAPAGNTFVNQQALNKIKSLPFKACFVKEKLDIKEGKIQVWKLQPLDLSFKPALPDWLVNLPVAPLTPTLSP